MALCGAIRSVAQDKTFTINADDWQHLQVTFNVGDLNVGKTVIDGQTFSTLAIDGYQPSMDNFGCPALPTFSRLIEVPVGAEFEVTVSDADYDTLEALEYRLVPVQLPRRKSDTTAQKLFISEVYSRDAFLGQREAMVEAVGIARDRRLARLQFSPVSYNPVTGQVIVCRQATVTVNYLGGDEQASKELFERYFSPAFSTGTSPINDLYPKAVRTTAPVRYVIVANSMFRGQLDTFVQWKRKKGFRTDIVYTDNAAVGTTTTSIAAYLKGLYDNATAADPAPTYVLLVGDVAQIPAFDGQYGSSSHITDLYYMTWTSGDVIPDCYYGRFSAQNATHLTPQIQKTLMYEQYTFADPSFLDRAVMVAGVDGGTAGDHGYTHADPAMDYAITNYINGAHGWSQVMYFKNNTSIVPTGTNVTIGSSASGNAATVRNYYNQGAGWINYSAHGGSTGWSTPNFGNTHVAQMTNTQKFGLFIGNCCQTNMYGESECFGEALLRKGNYCGGVGYIGGSDYTYWGEDFYWAVGLRSSINATMSMAYNSSNLGAYDRLCHTHNEAYSQWMTTQGSIIMAGNMAVQSSSSSLKNYYWEIYHLMGDPSVMPYLTQADTMAVNVASVITYGTTSLTVSAVPYAYVALVDTVTWTLIDAAYATASGSATLTLPATLQVGYYKLAASAQQYRTAFRTVRVMQPAGAFPVVSSITSAPLNAGDTVALTLHVENPGNATANNIVITLSCSNPLLTLSTNTVTLASLAAGGSTDLNAAVTAYVSPTAPDNTFADVNTSATWTGSTTAATSSLRLNLYAPVFSMTFSNDNVNLLPGSTTTVTATLHNNGHAPSRLAQRVFTTPTALLTVTPANTVPVSVAPSGSTSVTLTLQASAQLPQGITLPITCTYGDFSADLPVFIGSSFLETFEGGQSHLAAWNFPATYPWTTTNQQAHTGTYCLRSAYMGSNQNSNITYTVNLTSPDSVSFYYRVSSEANYDKFHFLIDSVSQMNASGEVDWTRAAFLLTAGSHTLTFRYSKDGSVSNGSDCAWIDDVTMPHSSHSVVFADQIICSADNTDHPAFTVSADSTVTFYNYILMPSGVSYDTAEACGSYQWRGRTYTISDVYSDTVPLTVGCDSLYMLSLTIHPLSEIYDTIDACDHYTWNDTEYTTSQNFTEVYTDVYGCDSTVLLHLAIHPTLYGTIFDTVENGTYTWNDSVYTHSGIYKQYLSTVYGCDSIVTLVLTVNNTHEGIVTLNGETLRVYPTPTTGVVKFSEEVEEVIVYDMTGRRLSRYANVSVIDLTALPRGSYLLRLSNHAANAYFRVILQ